ncbi:MAG: DUF5004 domain-containing protein [Bernardetiaceae bacterium]|nr:DUF5004 domain-containing protein [Bernardetiaceae bacterium]
MQRKFLFLAFLATVFLGTGCSTESNEDPLQVNRQNLSRTWRAANVRVGGVPLATALTLAGLPAFDVTAIRFTFREDGTYQASNLGPIPIPASGTWMLDANDPTRITIMPGNLSGTVSNLSAATASFSFQVPTAGTQLSVLGPNITIQLDVVPG